MFYKVYMIKFMVSKVSSEDATNIHKFLHTYSNICFPCSSKILSIENSALIMNMDTPSYVLHHSCFTKLYKAFHPYIRMKPNQRSKTAKDSFLLYYLIVCSSP